MNRARIAAFRSLVKSTVSASYSNLETEATLRSLSLSDADRNLYSRLYLGVVEKKITLDYLLSRISTSPLHTMEPEVLCLLELGAYQILYLDRIPDRAAIFEAGEIAKTACPHALSLINAVLRRLSKEKADVFFLLEQPGKKGLSLRYGYPKHLISLWQNAYGNETALAIMEAQNKRAPLTLRINTLKISVEDYEAILTDQGIAHHRNPICRRGITLEEMKNPTELYGFDEGLFFVQDAAAQRAVDLLEARPGQSVLDLCAAPGGKSFGAAMDMEGVGFVLSLELHPSRTKLIEEGAKRLGITILKAESGDSTVPSETHKGKFDRVICDVPCSGYGTIAKKPDIRHKNKEEADTLPPIQKAILAAGAQALKTGGRLVYSTCTLNPEENEKVTDAFLAEHPNFARCLTPETIFPKGGENDGFFCDVLEKRYE